MNLDRKKKKKKKKTADGGRTLVPSCHLPLSLTPKFFKPGLQGVQGLVSHKAPPSFRLGISLCIIIGESEFISYYTT